MNIALIVPTLNPGVRWLAWLEAYASQTLKPTHALVIDSASTDGYVEKAAEYGFKIITIKKEAFNHGGTRQLGINLVPDAELCIFMTQDAILHDPSSLENLVKPFLVDQDIAAVYGRQLPHIGANPLEAHARLFNYPDQSQLKSKTDIPRLGIKTAFCSNSFAAYRVTALKAVGGFPENTIFAEDMYVAAKMILSGYKVAYCAEALCRHSHHYSATEEFKRAFDIGVFHSREAWLLEAFGKPEGEGVRYIVSEIKYVLNKSPIYLWRVFVKTLAKLFGYKLGFYEHFFSDEIKKKMSLNVKFWE